MFSFLGAILISFILLIMSGFVARFLFGDEAKELSNIFYNLRTVIVTYTIGLLIIVLSAKRYKNIKPIARWIMAFWIAGLILAFLIYGFWI